MKPFEEACQSLAREMLLSAENEIAEAVSRALGRSDWSWPELRARFEYIQPTPGSMMTFLLDGEPILIINRPQNKQGVDDRGAAYIQATSNVRHLLPPNANNQVRHDAAD